MPEIRRSEGTDDEAAHRLTVVICAYTSDRWAIFQRALDAALKQMSPFDELLVVVDHNDQLLASCQDFVRDATIFANRHKRGLSGARNTAIEEALGSIIVFLDDDAIPLDGWLDALRAHYADERVCGVGGFAKPSWLSGRPAWFPDEFLWVVGCSHRGLPVDPQPIRNLLGANMSFRKTAFDTIGGFTEHMGRVGNGVLGCEETEFSIRLTNAKPGALLIYDPSAQVEHHVPPQRASLRYFLRRCWAEGLSKAEVARRVGRPSALSAERRYVSRVLPRGIWNGLSNAAAGDVWGAARSAAIVLGLAATAAGYCAGTLHRPYHDRG